MSSATKEVVTQIILDTTNFFLHYKEMNDMVEQSERDGETKFKVDFLNEHLMSLML